MGTGNPCDGGAVFTLDVCDDEICPKCNRPHFPSSFQPTLFPDNDTPEDLPVQTPQFPDKPIEPSRYPIEPSQYPIEPLQPINPLIPLGPQNPLFLNRGKIPTPLQPIQIPPPDKTKPKQPIIIPPPPDKTKQPIYIPPAPIDPDKGIQWLLFGGSTDFLIGQTTGAAGTGAAFLAILGADTPLLAGPQVIVGAVVLIATAIAFSIMGVIDALSGRPKLEATGDLARFANSPSPILSAIGQAAAKGLALGIPISTSNQAVWSTIFGPGINAAYADLQAMYPQYSAKQINVLMYILLSEMGDPASHSPVFIAQLLRDEIKNGTLKTPAAPNVAAQVRITSPGKLRSRNARITSPAARMV